MPLSNNLTTKTEIGEEPSQPTKELGQRVMLEATIFITAPFVSM